MMDTNSLDSCDSRTLTSSSSYTESSSESQSSSPAAPRSSVTSFLPPCRICGGVASGFHYGANTCEACKAFFRRCTSKDYQSKPCANNGSCTTLVRGRLACVSCRLAQCIKAGMTKSASKKGRYTHERRTQYTKEIKGESVTIPKVKVESTVPSSPSDSLHFEAKLSAINHLSSIFFPEMNTFMARKDEIHERMEKLMVEHCPGDSIPTQPIYSPGTGTHQVFKQFTDGLSNAAKLKHSAATVQVTSTTKSEDIFPTAESDDMLNIPFSVSVSDSNAHYRHDSTQLEGGSVLPHTPESSAEEQKTDKDTQAVNLLWDSWMMVAEILFVELTKFAKRLPGFDDLLLNDKIILLKGARIEVSTLMAHPACRPDKHLLGMYFGPTEELVLTPIDMFPQGAFTARFNEEHNVIMARLLKANYTLEDLNVIIAFVIFSADREGLEEQAKVELLQDDMLQLLECTLKKNHPNSAHKLAETLLLLPALREHSELMRRILYAEKEEKNPTLTPLIGEVL